GVFGSNHETFNFHSENTGLVGDAAMTDWPTNRDSQIRDRPPVLIHDRARDFLEANRALGPIGVSARTARRRRAFRRRRPIGTGASRHCAGADEESENVRSTQLNHALILHSTLTRRRRLHFTARSAGL